MIPDDKCKEKTAKKTRLNLFSVEIRREACATSHD